MKKEIEELEEEVLSPKYNRKYANKRKFLLKDKRSLYKKTQDKSILDGDVFYGKQLQKTKFDGMGYNGDYGSAYYGKTFIGVPLSKQFAFDYNEFQSEAMRKLDKHRKFSKKEQIDDFYANKTRLCFDKNRLDFDEDEDEDDYFYHDCLYYQSSVESYKEPENWWEEDFHSFDSTKGNYLLKMQRDNSLTFSTEKEPDYYDCGWDYYYDDWLDVDDVITA